MKKPSNIDKKMDNMLSESIQKTTIKKKQPVNEGWFDIITQGALIITTILWAFQLKGYSLNGSGIKKLFSDQKQILKKL